VRVSPTASEPSAAATGERTDTKIVESPVNQVTLTDRYTEKAVEFIRKNRKQPFFLYFANTMPHVPLFA
jgi:arylsulfatase A